MAAASSSSSSPLGPAGAGPRGRLSAVYTAKCGKVWLPVGGHEQPWKGPWAPVSEGAPAAAGAAPSGVSSSAAAARSE
eukprot:21699-Pyramimonas_sp.AAC.1